MIQCPFCLPYSDFGGPISSRVIQKGSFYRKSDSKLIQRFFCNRCKRGFSRATFSSCYAQKKRRINFILFKLLVSGVSQRAAARILKINRITVVRKFHFLAKQAQYKRLKFQSKLPLSVYVQFDEMETFEHTKCKPLSIPLAVDADSRRILSFEVCSMPAKGHLSKLSRKKYGFRRDDRNESLHRLMTTIEPFTQHSVRFLSDMKTSYPYFVRRHFGNATHEVIKGRRGCVVGQGELKSGGFDPLFSLNHTAAMIRAHVNRLFRRTWCTTKKPESLKAHLELYAYYHNKFLIKTSTDK